MGMNFFLIDSDKSHPNFASRFSFLWFTDILAHVVLLLLMVASHGKYTFLQAWGTTPLLFPNVRKILYVISPRIEADVGGLFERGCAKDASTSD